MKWIKCSDRLPDEDQHCWVYDYEKDVFDAWYQNKLPFYLTREINPYYKNGFVTDFETESYASLEEIEYWMPYFTPEPPEEST